MHNHHGEKNPFYGKQHTEATKQKMREAKERRRLIKARLLPEPVVIPKQTAAWKGRKHTEETRWKMSEAQKRVDRSRKPSHVRTYEEGYRLLVTAVVVRALKDNAVSFFDTETGQNYCDFIGVNPDTLLKKRLHMESKNMKAKKQPYETNVFPYPEN